MSADEVTDAKSEVKYALITRSGIFIETRHFESRHDIERLRKKFTCSVVDMFRNIRSLSTARLAKVKGKEYIVLPRFGGINLINNEYEPKGAEKYKVDGFVLRNLIKDGEKPKKEFKRTGTFRGNQKVVFDHIMKTYYSPADVLAGDSGATVKLGAGQGKSYLAIAFINKIQRKTLLICHNREIVRDWVTKHLSSEFPGLTIGTYHGTKKTDGDIVVGTVHSLSTDEMIMHDANAAPGTRKKNSQYAVPYQKFFSRFGLVIFDETQEYCTRVFKNALERAQAPYMLGLSATPEKSKFYKLAEWNIGDIVDATEIEGYEEKDVKFKGRVTAIKYEGPPEFCKKQTISAQGKEITSVVLTLGMITKDKYRLKLIADQTFSLLKENDKFNILIFAGTREYLLKIAEVINAGYKLGDGEFECGCGEECGGDCRGLSRSPFSVSLMSGVKDDVVKLAEEKANIILATYDYMGTGKSIPKLNAMILATPRKTNSKQFVGRILRLGANMETERHIVDIIDWGVGLKTQFGSRKQYYKEKEFPVTFETIKYTDINVDETLIDLKKVVRTKYDQKGRGNNKVLKERGFVVSDFKKSSSKTLSEIDRLFASADVTGSISTRKSTVHKKLRLEPHDKSEMSDNLDLINKVVK